MQLKGSIKRINETEVVSDKFKKRSFVIETDEKYPQTIQIETNQDAVDLLDGFAEGETVNVFINVRGRELTNKDGKVMVFNTLQAWKIESEGGASATPPAATESDSDDLPF